MKMKFLEATEKDVARFFQFIEKEKGDCWPWNGIKNSDGYGLFNFKTKSVRAHRFSFALANKKEPSFFVLHSCNNPSCVNPSHLREGTAKENMRDMVNSFRGFWQKKTHCPSGHEYSTKNTRYEKKRNNNLQRKCRECDRLRYYKIDKS